MNWSVEFGGSPHDVTVTASGEALADDFRPLFNALCHDARFESGMLILLDLTAIDLELAPQASMAELGNQLASLSDRCEGCALAIVCEAPLEFSLLRAADLGSAAGWMRVWVACSADEATTWLESQLALRAAEPAGAA